MITLSFTNSGADVIYIRIDASYMAVFQLSTQVF